MKKLLLIFSIPELRTKIFFTIGLLALYRLGLWVPLPFVDQANLKLWSDQTFGTHGSSWGQIFEHASMLAGTDLGTSTIFGLGIMPYISASIIFQLLASVIPALEQLQKEGEVGRKKINEYTRYATVAICLLQSSIWVNILMSQTVGEGTFVVGEQFRSSFFYAAVAVLAMTAGTIFLMWIGEQIDEFGIGNGISLIIMAGIIGRLPKSLLQLYGQFNPEIGAQDGIGVEKLILLVTIFLGVVMGVILITQGQRRIPIQSAKHVRGNRVFGGNRQYLPLRVNQAGVMPIIFASSLLLIPAMGLNFLMSLFPSQTWLIGMQQSFTSGTNFLYITCYVVGIYFFCYFWTAITFNPRDMANNLKDYGSFIPGYRPGMHTANYLEKVMLRVTYVGAAFLALIAILPNIVTDSLNIDRAIGDLFGGTGLLIIISVALDLVQKIDSHLIMRNHDGLLTTAASNKSS